MSKNSKFLCDNTIQHTQLLSIAININKACCCAFTITVYPLSSTIHIPVNSYTPYNLCSFKYHMTFYLMSCNATTSQCYAINNTRTCVEYVLILDYFVINCILFCCCYATSQHKSYGYQKLANLCVIILFNIHSFLIFRCINVFN